MDDDIIDEGQEALTAVRIQQARKLKLQNDEREALLVSAADAEAEACQHIRRLWQEMQLMREQLPGRAANRGAKAVRVIVEQYYLRMEEGIRAYLQA